MSQLRLGVVIIVGLTRAEHTPAHTRSTAWTSPPSPSSSTLGSAVSTILLVGVDLYIRGKLEAGLPGHRLVTTDSADPPDLVVADVSRVDPDDVAESYPDAPILGFTNHKDTAGLRRAHEAGFDQVVAKSALSERAAELVEELLAAS